MDARDVQMFGEPPEPQDPVPVPETLLSAIARTMDPRPPRSVVEYDRQPADWPTDVPRALLVALRDYLLEGAEDPDWSVGLSGNDWGPLAGEVELALDGKMTCPQCGGEGFVWSEESYQRELARITSETGEAIAQVRDAYGDWIGNVNCPTCNGAGVVRVEVCQR